MPYYDPYTVGVGAAMGRGRTNQYAPLGQGMDPRYGVPGWQWGMGEADTQELYRSEHGFNPETGGLEGPVGLVPGHLGLLYQAEHDRAVWNARYRMGKDALGFAQGANQLLQSYRPGGAAAMEAGTYGQMAQIQMQRAQMHQPLDLLSDYRRDQMARAGRSGRKESTIGSVLQGVGAIASLIPGVGTAVGAGLMAVGGIVKGQGDSRQAASLAQGQAGGQAYSGNYQQPGAAQPGQGSFAATQQAERRAEVTGQPPAQLPGQQPGAQPPTPGGTQPPPGPVGAPPPPGTGQSTLGGVGGDGPSAGGQPQPQGPGAEGPMAGMGGAPGGDVVGAMDGDFSPWATARHAAATNIVPEMQTYLTEHYVDLLESDAALEAIPYAIDREYALRV